MTAYLAVSRCFILCKDEGQGDTPRIRRAGFQHLLYWLPLQGPSKLKERKIYEAIQVQHIPSGMGRAFHQQNCVSLGR